MWKSREHLRADTDVALSSPGSSSYHLRVSQESRSLFWYSRAQHLPLQYHDTPKACGTISFNCHMESGAWGGNRKRRGDTFPKLVLTVKELKQKRPFCSYKNLTNKEIFIQLS